MLSDQLPIVTPALTKSYFLKDSSEFIASDDSGISAKFSTMTTNKGVQRTSIRVSGAYTHTDTDGTETEREVSATIVVATPDSVPAGKLDEILLAAETLLTEDRLGNIEFIEKFIRGER